MREICAHQKRENKRACELNTLKMCVCAPVKNMFQDVVITGGVDISKLRAATHVLSTGGEWHVERACLSEVYAWLALENMCCLNPTSLTRIKVDSL